jgi:DNA repair protein SbcD/Mre11
MYTGFMFRLLHTSDWHLGHILHGIDRKYEHARLLQWLADTVIREQIDALLIAGDVFDAANPPVEVQETWCRFLADLWRRDPHIQIVVIGGNHDSASRLEVNDPLLRALGRLHVIGGVPWKDGRPDLTRLILQLRNRAGEISAWVAAVPFLRASETGTGAAAAVAESTRRLYDTVLTDARSRREPGQAILAMGHLYMVGGKVSELSERRLMVGDQSPVPVEVFPEDVAYTALGHLHLAQSVGGRETVRYSGSLFPLSLSERRYFHEVVLVDLEGEQVRERRSLTIPRFVDILRVPEDGAATLDDAICVLRALPSRTSGPEEIRPLLEVCVKVDRPEPNLRQAIEAALEGKEARLVRLGVEQASSLRGLKGGELRPVSERRPEEVFALKYKRQFNQPPPDDILQAFYEVLRDVEQTIT